MKKEGCLYYHGDEWKLEYKIKGVSKITTFFTSINYYINNIMMLDEEKKYKIRFYLINNQSKNMYEFRFIENNDDLLFYKIKGLYNVSICNDKLKAIFSKIPKLFYVEVKGA